MTLPIQKRPDLLSPTQSEQWHSAIMLVTISFAKPLPEPWEGKSVDTLKEAGANDATLERLLNIDEAARTIGRAHWTLRRDIRRGKLRCIRIGRRIWSSSRSEMASRCATIKY